jgi:isopenicillin N synthase-like dioxygenase
MSPLQASTLPIIDIAPFLRDDQGELRASASAALHAACVKYGFFYLDISAYADPSETAKLTALAREFFALPQEEKDKISLSNEDHARGEVYSIAFEWTGLTTHCRLRQAERKRNKWKDGQS